MFKNMKVFECPYCKKNAVGPFGLLIFSTPWTFFKDCKYCQRDLKLNYSLLLFTIALPGLVLFFLSHWLGLFAILIAILYLSVLAVIPKISDPKLFKKRDAWSNSKK